MAIEAKTLLTAAKAALHSSAAPEQLVGRDAERAQITAFVRQHYLEAGVENSREIPSLYISGIPGTGKTALVREVLTQLGLLAPRVSPHGRSAGKRGKTRIKDAPPIFINCMAHQDAKGVYAALHQALVAHGTISESVSGDKAVRAQLEEVFGAQARGGATPGRFLVVLDEIDTLLSSSQAQTALYKLFEWPTGPRPRLVLIGIANALDLTERLLPRLGARGCAPIHMNFAPYGVAEMAAILRDRLAQTPDASAGNSPLKRRRRRSDASDEADETPGAATVIVHPSAVEMAARKAEGTGDVRKALDICRLAIDVAAQAARKQRVLQERNAAPGNGAAADAPVRVSLAHVMQATARSIDAAGAGRFRSKFAALSVTAKALLVATHAAATALSGSSAPGATLSVQNIHSQYARLASRPEVRQLGVFGPVSRSELIDLFNVLENQGLLSLRGGERALAGGGTFGRGESPSGGAKRRRLALGGNTLGDSRATFWASQIAPSFSASELLSALGGSAGAEPADGVFDEAARFRRGYELAVKLFGTS